MYGSWCSAAMLALESSGVVCLRMMRMSSGGAEAQRESRLMIDEKISANMEAAMTLMTGGSLDTVIGRYREQVAANADRLLASMFAPWSGCAAPRLPSP